MRARGTALIYLVLSISFFALPCSHGEEAHLASASVSKSAEPSPVKTISTELYLGTEIVGRAFDKLSEWIDTDAFKKEISDPQVRAEVMKHIKQGIPATGEERLNDLIQRNVEMLMQTPEIKDFLEMIATKVREEFNRREIPMNTRASVFYPQGELLRRIEEVALKLIPHFATEIADWKFGSSSTRGILAKKLLAREGALGENATSPVAIQLKQELRKNIQQAEKQVVALFTRELSLQIGDKGGLSAKLNLIPVPKGGTALVPERAETVVTTTEVDSTGARKAVSRAYGSPSSSIVSSP